MTLKTEIIINKNDAVTKAVELLNSDKVVALPTETVYGLAARCDSKLAVNKIFEIKNRPSDNPLIIHCDGLLMAEKYVLNPDERFYRLADAFWPGPLTIVTKRSVLVDDIVTAGQDTVAIRVPADDIFREIIKECKVPIAAPSANISGRPSPTEAEEVYRQLNGKIELIVDGGSCCVGVESTIVLLSEDNACILRPGDISKEKISKVLRHSINDKNAGNTIAPGMKYRHYAPSAEIVLYCGNSFVDYLKDKEGEFGVVCFQEEFDDILVSNRIIIGRSDNEKEQQHRLFKILNSLDSYNVKLWYVHADKRFEAVYNRLHKAADGRVDDK